MATHPSGPQPAAGRPPTAAGWASTISQLSALVAVLGGVYLLAGPAWTLVIGGTLVGVTSVLVEFLATRSIRPPAAPTPGGDR
jgi:hypothetical protein